ncbi:sensor histidine kinase [Paenibacillus lautus]|uniref:sensor histidine kinase n=1 Tax=Paenibacillus lautus TaxID=1401 RepID=UPI001C7CE687|nr:HAMP domain-containing sensor histidine kinase [Paenibacillus lautus]MBX4148229.1 HAMP domain-containing histidine kinase [Paenibacillus lautus]
MKTLYREFISTTLLILGISIFIGFILANVVYVIFTKEEITQQNMEVAEQIVHVLEEMHVSSHTVHPFLESVGQLGYQIYLANRSGEAYFFGEPFEHRRLPDHTMDQVLSGTPYMGKDGIWDQLWMMGHFSNDIRNTVGLPLQIGNQTYALFVKPASKILFSDIHMMLAGFIVAVAIVSLLGVIKMTKRLIHPISELSEATKAITNEDFTYSLDIHRKDELGQLAENFLRMQQQLQHNDVARKSFISNVSHDFQSPLMNIQGYGDLLLLPNLDEKTRLQYAGIVSDEARRLSNLTKQLLLITSLDQSGYPVKKSPLRLDLQIKESIKKHQWSLQDRNLTISYKLDKAVLYSDRELLAIVWDNLITNAIKYNQPNGHIFISCTTAGNKIILTFEDTGVGLSEASAKQVFERFYRVDATRKKDGTGLGLSIVKEIVTLLNGTITLESELAKGTTFTVIFLMEGHDESWNKNGVYG